MKPRAHMKLFPDHWANPDVEFEIVETPIGEPCAACPGKILAGDRGILLPYMGNPGDPAELAWHRDCFKRSLGIL